MTASAKELEDKKSPGARLLAVAIVAGLSACAAFFVYRGASGFAFDLSRTENRTTSAHDSAVFAGKVPFVADQLLYFPLAVALLGMVAIYLLNYVNCTGRQAWIILTSGSATMFTVCLVSLAFEITWVATSFPYTNYSGLYSAWTQPSRYFWPILALSLCLLAALIAGAVGVWALRSTRTVRSVSKARKVRRA
ncbi:hypothetical protein E3O44_00075 [Cryobacterium algoricola]|uniref:Uncharacterized protein n=1 Tax=Cryobacterium algoricola TaxID=1259183 RepID=A0ABY2IKR0_9MICO|nr:hypothetical protein [Cryobacterium algoricola]TFB91298.1 hypothetical protein E3O44_00075 [Cryobacterium algoricola]